MTLSPSLTPTAYSDRFYRNLSHPRGGVTFQVREGESDLWIHTDWNREGTARQALQRVRSGLQAYISRNPDFASALTPVPPAAPCPPFVNEMIRAALLTGVGPMAAVAGMIAQYVGRALLAEGASTVLVENGGDLFLVRPGDDSVIGLFAGESPLSLRVGLRIKKAKRPYGVATSSGTVGPSLSFGRADAVSVISHDAALADAAVTAIANRIAEPGDLEPALAWGATLEGVEGIVAIMGGSLAAWGNVELVKL